jgi:hypothetical protein
MLLKIVRNEQRIFITRDEQIVIFLTAQSTTIELQYEPILSYF